MLDDRELCEQLKNIYKTTGIDLLGTEGEDNSSPERVKEKAVTEFVTTQEHFKLANGLKVSVCYDQKCLIFPCMRAYSNTSFPENDGIRFEDIPGLMRFLGWLVDSRDVGKE